MAPAEAFTTAACKFLITSGSLCLVTHAYGVGELPVDKSVTGGGFFTGDLGAEALDRSPVGFELFAGLLVTFPPAAGVSVL